MNPTMVDPITAVGNFFKNYVNFAGRSTRAEYWWSYLFQLLVTAIAFAADFMLFGIQRTQTTLSNGVVVQGYYSNQTFAIIIGLAFLLPSIAVTIRRLHDTGHSGWWIFISLVPFIGGIWLIVLLALDSASTGWGEPTVTERTGAGPITLPQQYY